MVRKALLVALALCSLFLLAVASAAANDKSVNVAIVPDPEGEGENGGELPTSNFPGYNPSFSNIPLEDVGDGTMSDPLPAFDTVVLAQVCSISTQLANPTFKSRIESFVSNGGKLLIWDSECEDTDYSNFIFPFTTDNPGAGGNTGVLSDLEDN